MKCCENGAAISLRFKISLTPQKKVLRKSQLMYVNKQLANHSNQVVELWDKGTRKTQRDH